MFLLCSCKENFDFTRTFDYNSNFDVNKDFLPDEKKIVSSETSKDYLSYINTKDTIFNNNYNAVWMKPQVSYNNQEYNDISSGIKDYREEITSKSYYMTVSIIKYLINLFNNEYTINYNEFQKSLQNSKLIKISNNLGNDKTWVNITDYDANLNIKFKLVKSKFKDLNILLEYFLEKFNIIFKNYYKKTKKTFKFYPFFILKYKILNYYSSKTNNIFEVIINIVRENDINIFQLYLCGFIQNNKIILQNILLIGNDVLSSNLIRNGFEKKYYDINNNKNNKNDIKNTNLLKKDIKNTNLLKKESNRYNCFNINNNSIISTNNKLDCENEIDWHGKQTDIGIWDRKCQNNDECLFYKSNINYNNSYGKCMPNGYCEMPIDTEKLGYHFIRNDKKPKCYNCNTSKWLAFTILDECCEEQNKNSIKYKEKYDFLNGPDYAFNNDLNLRINEKIKNKFNNKEIYIKYEDLFDENKFTYHFE